MRKLRVWGMAAALALGVAGSAAAAEDEEPAKKPAPSFWERMFGRKQTPDGFMDELTVKAEDKNKASKEAEEAEKAREARRKAAALRAREEFQRREKVLDRLMELALQNNDRELYKKVESLGDRAWTVYLRKSGQPQGAAVAQQKDSGETAKGTADRAKRGEEP